MRDNTIDVSSYVRTLLLAMEHVGTPLGDFNLGALIAMEWMTSNDNAEEAEKTAGNIPKALRERMLFILGSTLSEIEGNKNEK